MVRSRPQRFLLLALALVLLCPLFATTVFADMGPHESVSVTVELPEERDFYATLLSSSSSTGPYSADSWKVDYSAADPEDPAYRACLAFASYEDPDGYYFLSYVFHPYEGSFSWGYMPPHRFKLLLWFPDTGELICGEAASTFAFDSVYRATLEDGKLVLEELHDYPNQILRFLARLAVTLLLELALAWLLGYRRKPVLIINICTQIGLNLMLALLAHNVGSAWFYFNLCYLLLELIVVFVEGLYYVKLLPGFNEKHPGTLRAVGFAVLANALSYAAGVLMISIWPMAF